MIKNLGGKTNIFKVVFRWFENYSEDLHPEMLIGQHGSTEGVAAPTGTGAGGFPLRSVEFLLKEHTESIHKQISSLALTVETIGSKQQVMLEAQEKLMRKNSAV